MIKTPTRLRLKKRTSINSLPKLHKEKEMADFRKALLAFAAVALVSLSGTTAYAQLGIAPAFSCTAQASNPPLVRSQGVTELVGDVVLTCTGGVPTPVGTKIPLSNITITLNTTVTDRILNTSTGLTEALLIVDDAYPLAPQPTTASGNTPGLGFGTQLLCQAIGNQTCAITAPGGGATTLTSGIGGSEGDYDGQNGHFNVFQGGVSATGNQVTFLGVPIDAPGTQGVLNLRITNVRANASQLAVGAQFSLAPIQMFIAVNGSQQVSITNPQPIVGYVTNGLITNETPATYDQCLPPDSPFSITFQEGFAAAFKPQTSSTGTGELTAQNVPGFSYNSESGLFEGTTVVADGSTTLGVAGLADHGTKLMAVLTGIPTDVSLSVPTTLNLTDPLGNITSNATAPSLAILVSTDNYGYSAPLPPGTLPTASTGVITPVGGTATIVYEITNADPNTQETLNVPVEVNFNSNVEANLLGTISAALSYAPLPPNGVAGWTAPEPITSGGVNYPIPRFVTQTPPVTVASIVPCTCNLLFPFVTNQQGFDTGLAIANTTTDPYGTAAQQGPINLFFYGQLSGGTALTPAQAAQTTPTVPTGCIFTMTLSGGGSIENCAAATTDTVPALAGFQGYLIAQADFQFCHGYAFITDMGAHNLAEGYLAIQLDKPSLNRTGQYGENEGH